MRGPNPFGMLAAHCFEFDWRAKMQMAALSLVRVFMFEQCQRADALENVVTTTVLYGSVMHRRTCDGSVALCRGLVEVTGKHFRQRRIGAYPKQPVAVLTQARPFERLTLFRRN